jgi:hypothetical protein
MSPEAISLSVAGKINKFNATHKAKIPPLTGEQQSKISAMVEDILNTPEGRERNIKVNELNILINSFIPSSFADKATTVWKAGLLTSLRTHGRNIIGNAIQGTTEIVKDIPATWADMLMSSKTGQRTTTFTTKGVGEFGSKTTRQQMADIITKGYDPSKSIEKFDIKKVNWGNNKGEQALKKVTDVVFNVLDAEDKPFYNAAFARSLYNQAGAAAINAGRKGDASFIENLVKNPSEDMLKNATADANIAAFRDKGVLSKTASGVKRAIANDKTGEVGKVVAETMLPFTGVPSSVAGQMVAYSPIGLIRGATDTGKVLIKNMPELQRQAAQEVGRGIIGTALFIIGAYLMEKGLMTGQPKDAVEAEQWKLEGKQPNSVLINGKWRSIGSVGPQTLILLAGAKYNEEMNNPEGSIGSFAGNIGKDFLSQTFLAGVQQPLNAITDPARYGKSYVSGQAGSIVPNIIKDFAKSVDPYARETSSDNIGKSIVPGIQYGIPFLRNQLPPRRDVLGNPIAQEPTGLSAFYDVFNSKTPISNVVVDELKRLNEVGERATPSKLSKSQTINNIKVKLNAKELDMLEEAVGNALRPALEKLIVSPEYQRMSDEDKASAIDKVVTRVRKQVKSEIGPIGTPDMGYVKSKELADISKDKQAEVIEYAMDGKIKSVKKTISLPKLTSNNELNKKILSDYKSDLSDYVDYIMYQYKNGLISEEKAGEALDNVRAIQKWISNVTKSSSKSGKKVKKVNISAISQKTLKPVKVKVTPSKKIDTFKVLDEYRKLKSKTPNLTPPNLEVGVPKFDLPELTLPNFRKEL